VVCHEHMFVLAPRTSGQHRPQPGHYQHHGPEHSGVGWHQEHSQHRYVCFQARWRGRRATTSVTHKYACSGAASVGSVGGLPVRRLASIRCRGTSVSEWELVSRLTLHAVILIRAHTRTYFNSACPGSDTAWRHILTSAPAPTRWSTSAMSTLPVRTAHSFVTHLPAGLPAYNHLLAPDSSTASWLW